jgi:hypothetical protein
MAAGTISEAPAISWSDKPLASQCRAQPEPDIVPPRHGPWRATLIGARAFDPGATDEFAEAARVQHGTILPHRLPQPRDQRIRIDRGRRAELGEKRPVATRQPDYAVPGRLEQPRQPGQ